MSKANQEPAVAFAEVLRSVKSSGSQHSSLAFDGRFMVYCQGLKLFIPEDFQTESLLKVLRADMLAGLPKEIEEYVIPEGEVCSKCGGQLKVIGQRIVRTEVELSYILW